MQVRIFSGAPEKVEKAINHWADDGSARQVVNIMPLQAEPGEITLMFIFNPTIPGVVVPTKPLMRDGLN